MTCITVPNPWNGSGISFDPSLITITGVNGISGGGDLTASRTLGLDLNSLIETLVVDPTTDYLPLYDWSLGAERKVKISNLPFGASAFNYFNTIYIDQSGGTSDTYGVLAGAIDGLNTTFTVSTGIYDSGTLGLSRNGQIQTQGTGEDWIELVPGSGTITVYNPPIIGDELTVWYQVQSVSTSTLLSLRDVQNESADYILLTTDQGAKVDATTLPITITLPPAASVIGLHYWIKKVDATINNVIVEGDGVETIDGALNAPLTNINESITVVSDGTEWSII